MRVLLICLIILNLSLVVYEAYSTYSIYSTYSTREAYKGKGGDKNSSKGSGWLLTCSSSTSTNPVTICHLYCPSGTTQIGAKGAACTYEVDANKTGESK